MEVFFPLLYSGDPSCNFLLQSFSLFFPLCLRNCFAVFICVLMPPGGRGQIKTLNLDWRTKALTVHIGNAGHPCHLQRVPVTSVCAHMQIGGAQQVKV